MNFNFTIDLRASTTRITSHDADEAAEAAALMLRERDLDPRDLIVADRRRAAGLDHDASAAEAYDEVCDAAVAAVTAGWMVLPDDVVVSLSPIDDAMIADAIV